MPLDIEQLLPPPVRESKRKSARECKKTDHSTRRARVREGGSFEYAHGEEIVEPRLRACSDCVEHRTKREGEERRAKRRAEEGEREPVEVRPHAVHEREAQNLVWRRESRERKKAQRRCDAFVKCTYLAKCLSGRRENQKATTG